MIDKTQDQIDTSAAIKGDVGEIYIEVQLDYINKDTPV